MSTLYLGDEWRDTNSVCARAWPIFIALLFIAAGCQAKSEEATGEPPVGFCRTAEDCVWAVRGDQCCDCGAVYTRAQAVGDENLVILDTLAGTVGPEAGLTPEAECAEVACSPCPAPPIGLVCGAGVCREASWWSEKLQLCLKDDYAQVRTSCLLNTAVTAYLQAGAEQALEVCGLVPDGVESQISYQEFCRAEIGRAMSGQDPERAVEFCRSNLELLASSCISEAAQAILIHDADRAYLVCYQIEIKDERDQAQRDACMLAIAMEAAENDTWLALRACNRMEIGRQECREIVLGE